jgi:epoxyqueuosine reductase QueG
MYYPAGRFEIFDRADLPGSFGGIGVTADMIINFVNRLLDEPGGNYVPEDAAISPDCASLRIFDSPIMGVATSCDECFERFRESGVVGPHFITPREWLPGARSVLSIFFPLSGRVVESNAAASGWPSGEWLHGRVEGQKFIFDAMSAICGELERRGHPSLVPSLDPRFLSVRRPGDERLPGLSFTSVWSERHVAYACGLGTFGLSKGLITKRGIAGRFGSVVTTLEIQPTGRDYTGVYDYCVMCGACARRCPAGAITMADGKSHPICVEFVDRVREKFAPRFGCGKCQSGVPCGRRAPGPRH